MEVTAKQKVFTIPKEHLLPIGDRNGGVRRVGKRLPESRTGSSTVFACYTHSSASSVQVPAGQVLAHRMALA